MSDWKFDPDDVGSPDEEEPESVSPPVEPGSPKLENVIPFLLGIGVALVVFAQVI